MNGVNRKRTPSAAVATVLFSVIWESVTARMNPKTWSYSWPLTKSGTSAFRKSRALRVVAINARSASVGNGKAKPHSCFRMHLPAIEMFYLAIVSLIWAFSFGLIRSALVGVDAFIVATLRLGCASLIFYPSCGSNPLPAGHGPALYLWRDPIWAHVCGLHESSSVFCLRIWWRFSRFSHRFMWS